MLSITCDNATNNDRMVEELAQRIPSFSGQTSHVRCFAHVINLVAKSLLKQFDSPKCQNGNTDGNDGSDFLFPELADDIDLEDEDAQSDPELVSKDNTEGLVDVLADMDIDERKAFELEIMPIRTALAKVSTL